MSKTEKKKIQEKKKNKAKNVGVINWSLRINVTVPYLVRLSSQISPDRSWCAGPFMPLRPVRNRVVSQSSHGQYWIKSL